MTRKIETGLNLQAIRDALNFETWEQVEPDREERRVYLGTVFALTPSGKYYMPYACSNVAACPVCKGSGTIGAHRKRRIRAKAKARANELIADAIRRYGRGSDGVRAQYAMRQRADRLADGFSCPRCEGIGSAEARDDEVWQEQAESELNSIGACLTSGDGDPCDLFACESRDVSESE